MERQDVTHDTIKQQARHGHGSRATEADPKSAATASPTSGSKKAKVMSDKINLQNDIRYAQRLCERTSRLYRRAQTAGTFASVIGGGAMAASMATHLPGWVGIAGGVVLAVFGAALIAIRPADKAAANDADLRRYSRLLSDSHRMDVGDLREAILKAREGNAAEVEPLRKVAYNDVVHEIGRDDAAYVLAWHERLLAAVA